jgi:predicted nucleic acid-binding protein
MKVAFDSAEQARLVVDRLRDHLTLVEPTGDIYDLALSRCASKGHVSGAIFDAIHLMTAEASQADVMLTFNPDDFDRLREPSSPRVLVPPDPPSLERDESSSDRETGG